MSSYNEYSEYNGESAGVGRLLIAALKGLAVAVVAAAVLLFGFCAIGYQAEDPDSLSPFLGYSALYISAAVAGAVSSRVSGEIGWNAVISSAASGGMLLALIVIMSFLPVETSGVSPLITVLMYGGIPLAAALAGIIFRRKARVRARAKRRTKGLTKGYVPFSRKRNRKSFR